MRSQRRGPRLFEGALVQPSTALGICVGSSRQWQDGNPWRLRNLLRAHQRHGSHAENLEGTPPIVQVRFQLNTMSWATPASAGQDYSSHNRPLQLPTPRSGLTSSSGTWMYSAISSSMPW